MCSVISHDECDSGVFAVVEIFSDRITEFVFVLVLIIFVWLWRFTVYPQIEAYSYEPVCTALCVSVWKWCPADVVVVDSFYSRLLICLTCLFSGPLKTKVVGCWDGTKVYRGEFS